MSPTTSYACSSSAYDVQLEKLSPRAVKSWFSSCCPWASRNAPRTLTGSLRDQSARRGAASPLCSASSASYRTVLTQARKSSRSVMPSACSDLARRTVVTGEPEPSQKRMSGSAAERRFRLFRSRRSALVRGGTREHWSLCVKQASGRLHRSSEAVDSAPSRQPALILSAEEAPWLVSRSV